MKAFGQLGAGWARRALLVGAAFAASAAAAAAQPVGACTFYPEGAARGFELVSPLCEGWRRIDPRSRQAQALTVPYTDRAATEHVARLEPAFTAAPLDTLWLYFEGVAGQASITWNGQLLDLTTHALADRLVPLPPGLVRLGPNYLVVRMRPTGFAGQASPQPFTGLYRGVFVVRRSRRPAQGPAATPSPDVSALAGRLRVARYAPWSEPLGPEVDSATLARHLLWLRAYDIRALQFAFRPSHRLRRQVQAFGLTLVDSLPPGAQLVHFNAYPLPEAMRYPFWLDAAGRPTRHFGSSWPPGALLVERVPQPMLLVLGFVPLLLLVIWRLTDAPSFYALLSYDLIARRAYEQIARGVTLRGVPVLLITLVRVGFTVALVLMLALGLRQWGRPDLIPARPDSALGQLLRVPQGAEWQAGLLLLGALAAWLLLKLLVVRALGTLYRLRRVQGRLLLIQALAAFPVLVAAGVVAFTALVAAPTVAWGGQLTLLALGVAGLVAVAYAVLLLREMQRLFETPLLVNVLYLCALEILPWLWFA